MRSSFLFLFLSCPGLPFPCSPLLDPQSSTTDHCSSPRAAILSIALSFPVLFRPSKPLCYIPLSCPLLSCCFVLLNLSALYLYLVPYCCLVVLSFSPSLPCSSMLSLVVSLFVLLNLCAVYLYLAPYCLAVASRLVSMELESRSFSRGGMQMGMQGGMGGYEPAACDMPNEEVRMKINLYC